MRTACQNTDLTRAVALALVKRAERQTDSKMAAYDSVAKAVGASGSWLRKFINGQEAKEPNWTTGWNIIEHYNRICDRVEAEIELERMKHQALKREIDEVTSTLDRALAETSRDSTGATASRLAD